MISHILGHAFDLNDDNCCKGLEAANSERKWRHRIVKVLTSVLKNVSNPFIRKHILTQAQL